MKRASSAVLELTGDRQRIKPKGNSMKRKASIFGALAVLAGLFLASSPASASTYTCDGGATPFTGNYSEGSPKSDSFTITHSGSDCVVGGDAGLTGNIAVTGDITITVTGGSVTFKKNLISRDGKIKVTSSNSDVIAEKKVRAGGTIEILAGLTAAGSTGTIRVDENMTSDLLQTGTGQGHILLRAQGTVRTKNIYTTGEGQPSPRTVADGQSVKTGGIQIDANLYGSSSEFVIGSTGSGSYVDGELDTRTTTGGGTSSSTLKGGVRITNGTTSSTGDITLTAMSKIKVRATQSRSGMIVLNAQSGKVILPAGTLDANGHLFDNNDAAQGYQAGGVGLFAATVETEDGTIISASQNKHSSTGVTNRQVAIVANTIKFKGTSGLEVHADGNAASFSARGTVYALPKGLMVPESNNSVSNFQWTFSVPNFSNATDIVKFDGTGTGSDFAPLKVTADGFCNEVRFAGGPIEFYGGAVTIHSRGMAYFQGYYLNEVNFSSNPTGSGHSVKFAGKGAIAIDADGIGILEAGTYGANAGFVNFSLGKSLTVNTGGYNETSFTVTAHGTTSKGSGGQVRIATPSTITLDSHASAELDAKGTSTTSGTGSGGTVTVDSGDAITVGGGNGKLNFNVASAATGNGGKLYITGYPVSFVGNTGMLISANGGITSGDGGEIWIFSHGGNITINNSAANEVTFEAKAPTSGNGGTVGIRFAETLSVKGANISVDSKGSNGQGGTIALTDIGTLSFLDSAGTILTANGSGSGSGGNISLSADNSIMLGTDAGEVSLTATGNVNGGTGNGGTISITSNSTSDTLIITAVHADVSAGDGGNGGQLSFQGAKDIYMIGNFHANGSGSGNGGSVNVQAATEITMTDSEQNIAEIQVRSGPDGGSGGVIGLYSGENYPMDFSLFGTDTISATGKDSGGFVWIAHSGRFLILNHVVRVGVGDSVTDPGTYAGIIGLNGEMCQQWLSGSSSWPKSYWNCVNLFEPVTGDEIALTTAQGLPSSRKTELASIKNQIYVMRDVDQFNTFFGEEEDPAGGLSFLEPDFPSDKIFNSAVFQNGDTPVNGYVAFDTDWIPEIAAHELAHGIDEAKGNTSTADASYLTGLAKDRAFLDYANGVSGTLKVPCSTNGTAPFDDVIDHLMEQSFCSGATLVNPNGIYDGLTNSQIAARSTSILEGSLHVYGHAFSYQHYVKSLSPLNYFNTTVDGLFEKGYFKCAQQVAAGLAGTTASSPFSYSCN